MQQTIAHARDPVAYLSWRSGQDLQIFSVESFVDRGKAQAAFGWEMLKGSAHSNGILHTTAACQGTKQKTGNVGLPKAQLSQRRLRMVYAVLFESTFSQPICQSNILAIAYYMSLQLRISWPACIFESLL